MRIASGTRAVVTGAGSGLGRAFAHALASRGAVVVAADVREATARATADEIRAAGGEAHAVACDVTVPEDMARLAGGAGVVDLLINNAGIGAAGPVGVAALETWRHTIDVNLWGVILGCHHFVPAMRARGRGHVLNVASAAALVSPPGMGAYNVTKAAVLALSETLVGEVAEDGVGVTVLCPGFFRTNIVDHAVGAVDDGQRRFIEAEMARSKHDAADVARIALDAVERGKLYALPHAQIRWLWRVKRVAPGLFTRIIGRLDRRGYFSRP
jgi:short-subunit dehydrogenase